MDYGPIWDWTDKYADEFSTLVTEKRKDIASKDKAKRKEAVQLLITARARQAIPLLIELLADPDAELRTLALRGIRVFNARKAIPQLVSNLQKTQDGEWAQELMKVLITFKDPLSLEAIQAIAQAKPGTLAFQPNSPAALVLRKKAIDLLGVMPTKQSVPVLLMVLENPFPELRQAANDALENITNQRGMRGAGTNKGQAKVREHWQTFWTLHQKETRTQWMVAGFRDSGFKKIQDELTNPSNIKELLKAITSSKDYLSLNAQWALNLISGRNDDPTLWDTKAAAAKNWRIWWERNSFKYKL